jgi:hypothetical protein
MRITFGPARSRFECEDPITRILSSFGKTTIKTRDNMNLSELLNQTDGMPSTNREINNKLIGCRVAYQKEGVSPALWGLPGTIIGVKGTSPTTNKAYLVEVLFDDGFEDSYVPTSRISLLHSSAIQ